MKNSGSNYPLLVIQQDCKLIRSDQPVRDTPEQMKNVMMWHFVLYWHFEISWYQPNFTRFCTSQKKSQESQNRCISLVKHKMCVMLVSKENLCLLPELAQFAGNNFSCDSKNVLLE